MATWHELRRAARKYQIGLSGGSRPGKTRSQAKGKNGDSEYQDPRENQDDPPNELQ